MAKRKYSQQEIRDIEDDWDYLWAWMMTMRGIKGAERAFKSRHEIVGDLDEWLENRFPSLIDYYAEARGISFEDAEAALVARPSIRLR